ncbi:hypothetical protein VTK73DRAFT_3750 [Phialemonium thermophilum]|uniref:Uncharacterized protein n=1 Tax=Phialemonium thermophilum TaxID=223376 RepID=A0ABR3VF35_9PEZI
MSPSSQPGPARLPFRCPLRRVLVSGRQKGQGEAQLVIKRAANASPAMDPQRNSTVAKHVLLVYTGNRPAPDITYDIESAPGSPADASASFRYSTGSRHLLFDVLSQGNTRAIVELYFPDALILHNALSVLKDVGVLCRNMGPAAPSTAATAAASPTTAIAADSARSPSNLDGHPHPARPANHGCRPPPPEILPSAHVFSQPLMLRTPEGRLTPVQIQRVARMRRPTATPAALVQDASGGGTFRLESAAQFYHMHPTMASLELARPSSVPPGSQESVSRMSCLSTDPPSSSHACPHSPTADSIPGRCGEAATRRIPMLSCGHNHGNHCAAAREESFGSPATQPIDLPRASACASCTRFPSSSHARQEAPEGQQPGVPSTGLLTPRSENDPGRAAPPATRHQSSYQDAKVQAGSDEEYAGEVSRLASSKLLDVIDVWEKERRQFHDAIDDAVLDDADLRRAIRNYQQGLESALSRLP